MIQTSDYNVAIYLRLSREDERNGESASISTQREILLNYIKDHNLNFVSEYIDDGVSGTTFDRKGFNQMIKDVELGKINMIITKDTSRLGRDHIEFGYYVERYFPEHNIRYVAVNDGIDTFNNSYGNDMLLFKSAFNDMYVKDISNKIRTSLYAKKRSGKFVGCYAPYGYQKDPGDKNKLVIDEETSLVVKRIFNMFIKGMSIASICAQLTNDNIPTPSMQKNMKYGNKKVHYGVWSQRTVSDILKNPTYIGNLTQCRNKKVNYKSKKRIHNKKGDWIIAKDSCPAIISCEIFDCAESLFSPNKYMSDITNSILLKGLVFCKECNHTIGWRVYRRSAQNKSDVRVYGNCNYWVKRKRQAVCTPHSIKYFDFEEAVVSCIKRIIRERVNKEQLIKNVCENKNNNKNVEKYDNEIVITDNKLKQLHKKLDLIYNDKIEGIISLDMYKRFYQQICEEIIKLETLKENVINKKSEIINCNIEKYCVQKVKDFLKQKDISRDFIVNMVNKIEIDENNNIDIYYKFNH